MTQSGSRHSPGHHLPQYQGSRVLALKLTFTLHCNVTFLTCTFLTCTFPTHNIGVSDLPYLGVCVDCVDLLCRLRYYLDLGWCLKKYNRASVLNET